MELKAYNKLIPSYLEQNFRKKDGFYLCPLCNKPLTYIENTDHIECDNCNNIHGLLHLIMYNEHLDFKNALTRANKLLQLTNFLTGESEKLNAVRDYDTINKVAKRFIGLTYENDREYPENYYKSYYSVRPLIFTSGKYGALFYHTLLSYEGLNKNKIANIITIQNVNHTSNALSVLLHSKKNHKLKIFLVFNIDNNALNIKQELLRQFRKYKFYNFVILDLSLNNNYLDINDFYKRDPDSFKFYLANSLKNYDGLYKKTEIENIFKTLTSHEQTATTPTKATNKTKKGKGKKRRKKEQ